MSHETIPQAEQASRANLKSSGYLLGAAGVLMTAFILMHPTVHAHGMEEFREGVRRIEVHNMVVHGTLIAVQALAIAGLLGLCDLLGMTRTVVRVALIAYVMGSLAECGAATINGFVVPSLLHHTEPGEADALSMVIKLCHHTNHLLAQGGVITLSAAVVIWSIVMWRAARVAAVIGMVCGGVSLLALVSGHLHMDVHGFGLFVIGQSVWYFAAAWKLIRG